MTKGYHRFLYDTMMEVMGGDVINFTALTYKGVPFMSGFDGVDYSSLRTLINHKVNGVKDIVARVSAFHDPFNAWLRTGFNPDEAGLTNFLPIWLRNWVALKDSGNSRDSIGFFDVIFRDKNPFEVVSKLF